MGKCQVQNHTSPKICMIQLSSAATSQRKAFRSRPKIERSRLRMLSSQILPGIGVMLQSNKFSQLIHYRNGPRMTRLVLIHRIIYDFMSLTSPPTCWRSQWRKSPGQQFGKTTSTIHLILKIGGTTRKPSPQDEQRIFEMGVSVLLTLAK